MDLYLLLTFEEQDKYGGHLEDRLADDVLHHRPRYQRFRPAVGLSKQQYPRSVDSVARASEASVSMISVDPQHLDGFQWRVLHANKCEQVLTGVTV